MGKILVVKADHSIEITGTLELVPGIATIQACDDGTWEYDGNGTDMLWDDQKTVERNGQKVFVTIDGTEYLENEIEVIDEEDEADG